MKFRKLPPLHVLHTFEVAAVNLSFKLTAEQLALTPSAVSHQMLALEQFLGTPLFVRKNRRLFLTDAGVAYQKSVSSALEQLREASAALRSSQQKARIRLSATKLAQEIADRYAPSDSPRDAGRTFNLQNFDFRR